MARASVAVAAVVLALAVVGALLIAYDDRAGPPIVIEDPLREATIVVAVEGAVARPGVYPLPAGARVQDAVTAAGGHTADADLAAINLARRVADEDRVVIPDVAAAGAADPAEGQASTAAPTDGDDTLIDLNAATIAELDELPGIGSVLAQRIVDYRTANGSFRTVEELANVEGISSRMVDELRPLVTVSP